MKLVLLFGDAAVGKMTVGQELCKITPLRLFHNHMTIEPVIEILGRYDRPAIEELREVIFRRFAASDRYGMVFTFMWAFDHPEDWEYVEHVKSIFAPYDAQVYYVELDAPLEVRLERNRSDNRLANKPSKRDLEASQARLLADNVKYRCVSEEGEIPFDNYLRIDNTRLSPVEAARLIKERFDL